MYICIHTYIYKCAYMYMYICIYIHAHIYIYIYIYVYAYVYTYIYICILVFICTYIYIHVYTHILVNMNTYIYLESSPLNCYQFTRFGHNVFFFSRSICVILPARHVSIPPSPPLFLSLCRKRARSLSLKANSFE